ncbi:uncharacterized protein at3g06530 [Phtheirospermum japonicum]|uniref:Uncharacterized protein at3g06530 n=1 Tax=Phtheirospermum japonicum TaxID=374723 RepID=A0A830B3L5_9LAMI|nr:uncharacterized protein at3g06530 [Phtheirospermum japonicum]
MRNAIAKSSQTIDESLRVSCRSGSPGETVAVEVLATDSKQGEKEFQTEEAFPHGGDCSGLVVIYEQCVRTFWHEDRYKDDLRYLKLQSVESIPKKTVSVLNEIRDVSEILSGLTKDFNIDKFLDVFLDSLLEHSATDDQCSHTLLSIIETVPMKDYVSRVVVRLLSMRINISQGKINLVSSESGL